MATFNLSSANALSSAQSKKLPLGKELTFLNGPLHMGQRNTRMLCRGFNSLPHNPDFKQPWVKRPLKTLWRKEKMLVTSIFSFSHNVFNPIKVQNHHFKHLNFVVCKCFQFGQGQIFVV